MANHRMGIRSGAVRKVHQAAMVDQRLAEAAQAHEANFRIWQSSGLNTPERLLAEADLQPLEAD